MQQFGAPSHPTGIVVGGSVADGNVVRNNPLRGDHPRERRPDDGRGKRRATTGQCDRDQRRRDGNVIGPGTRRGQRSAPGRVSRLRQHDHEELDRRTTAGSASTSATTASRRTIRAARTRTPARTTCRTSPRASRATVSGGSLHVTGTPAERHRHALHDRVLRLRRRRRRRATAKATATSARRP